MNKPFDLQKALAGQPVITRDGRMVDAIYYLKELDGDFRVMAIINGSYNQTTEQGKALGFLDNLDLFMSPVKKTVWVNMWYTDGDIKSSQYPFDTKEEALKHIITSEESYIGTYPIEIEL